MANNFLTLKDGITLGSLAADPSNPVNGDIYYNKTSNKFRKYENGAWSDLDTTGGGSSSRTINTQTGTTYTFALTDGSNNGTNPLVTLDNASAITATVPPNSSVAFPIGSQIDIVRLGAGGVTISPGSGVTVNSPDNATQIRARYSLVSLIKIGTDTWDLCGDILIPSFISATGGTITTDGNFKVHSFTSSGSFTITSGSGTVESLVVAGGGGGGGQVGGGGGAGGFKYTTPGANYVAGTYTVTVGGGGAGSAGSSANGSNGSNSVFDTITSTGGGGGSYFGGGNGAAGGSGGGAGGQVGSTGGGASPSGQGSAGGNGDSGGTNRAAGGGGGASAVGGNGNTNGNSGNGGSGTSNSITGSAVTYAGGGGGGNGSGTGGAGTGGAGGGGNGSATGSGAAATANTGGGGGGSGSAGGNGGNGGSGIVILRYQFQ